MKTLPSHNDFYWLNAVLRKSALMAALICLAVGAVSCRSVNEVIREVPIHDTTYITKTERDSTYIDRWHTEYVKGDTIYITDQVTKLVTKTITDTAYKYVEKPVTVTVCETKEVEKPLSWWQKTMMWLGVGFILVLIGFAVALYVKLKG